MSTLDRKLLRDLTEAWGKLLAIAGIMAIGVACFIALRSAYANLDQARQRYYAQCRMADFSIELKKLPVIEAASLERLRGVTAIRPRLQFSVTADLEGVALPISGLVLSLPERRQGPILNDIVLKRGSYFTEGRDTEVIVNDAFARAHGLRPGDTMHLLLNDRRQELQIVGTAVSSEFVYLLGPGAMIPDPEHFGVFYLKADYLEQVFDFRGACNQVIGLLDPEVRARPEPLLDRMERLFDSYGVFGTTPRKNQISNRFVMNELNELRTFGVALPAVFLVVAALILGVLVGRLVEHQRTEIGTLKALGYSHRRVQAHVLQFGLAIGVLGGLVGGGLGYLLAGGMTQIYVRFFEFPDLRNVVDPFIYAQGMLTSLACGLLGSWRGGQAVLHLEPAEAMRPRPPRRGGAIGLERLGWFWSRVSTAWRLVLRNVVRTSRRSLVGVLSTAAATSLLAAGFLFNTSAFSMLESQFRLVQRSDLDLGFRDSLGREALLDLRRLPGVDRAEPLLMVGCTLRNGSHVYKGGITGLGRDATLTVPRDASGDPVPLPDSGLLLERHLAEVLRVAPGDMLTVEPTVGRRGPRRMRVDGLVESSLGMTAYAEINALSRLMDEEFALNSVQMRLDPSPVARAAMLRELKRFPVLQAVNDREDMYRNLKQTFVESIQGFTGFLVIAAGFILFGTALNASLVGLAERRREVATMLVLGYTPWTVGGLFLRESLLVSLTGLLVGLPGGYGLYRAASQVADKDLFRLPRVDPLAAWGWTLLLGLAFTLASHVVVHRAIVRMNWRETLNVRE